jgi:excisionase family DNA binding protein
MENPGRRCLTVKDVAGRLKISIRKVFRLKASGELPPSIKIGRCLRWREADIDKWIDDGGSFGSVRTKCKEGNHHGKGFQNHRDHLSGSCGQ